MSDTVLIYYVKANLLLSIFTLFFLFFYRKETHFHLNRFYLLIGIISALLIPIIKITTQTIQPIPIQVNEFIVPEFMEEPNFGTSPEQLNNAHTTISLIAVFRMIYFTGVFVLGLRFVFFIFKLLALIKKGALRRLGNTIFVATSQNVQPFSFFNFVFYNAETTAKNDLETIMAHEKIHVRQLHSFDLLLTEILVVLFWFNPFVFLLRNAVRANHEFLADAAVLNRGTDKLEYLQTLAVQATSLRFGDFGSHFKSSTLKNRIVMITKKKSTLVQSLKYILVLPLLAIFLYSFSIRVFESEVSAQGGSLELQKKYFAKGAFISFDSPKYVKVKNVKGSVNILAGDEFIFDDIKYSGGKMQFDRKANTLTFLGDSCFAEKLNPLNNSKSVGDYLKKGTEFKFPAGEECSIRASGSITSIKEQKVQLSRDVEIAVGNKSFYGDLIEVDFIRRTLTVLGDSCYVKEIDKPEQVTSSKLKGKANFIQPITASDLKRIGSRYGARMHPIYKVKKMHNGVDYVAESGTAILSVAQGKVREVHRATKKTGYGNYIVIDHPDGFSSLYAQLLEFNVEPGDVVKQGDVVAFVGSSGMSTGSHLHFELKKDGEYVNPAIYIIQE